MNSHEGESRQTINSHMNTYLLKKIYRIYSIKIYRIYRIHEKETFTMINNSDYVFTKISLTSNKYMLKKALGNKNNNNLILLEKSQKPCILLAEDIS